MHVLQQPRSTTKDDHRFFLNEQHLEEGATFFLKKCVDCCSEKKTEWRLNEMDYSEEWIILVFKKER